MKSVQVVPVEFIHRLWPEIELFLKDPMESGGMDYTLEQMKVYLVGGVKSLLVCVEDEKIIGAMVVEFCNMPAHRIAIIVALGGAGLVEPEVFAQAEQWMRSQGATMCRAWAKDAQARLYRQKAGFTNSMHVVEKLL